MSRLNFDPVRRFGALKDSHRIALIETILPGIILSRAGAEVDIVLGNGTGQRG